MKTISKKNNLNCMSISKERLAQFMELFEHKTGRKLSEKEALVRAETLLRTISILYQPVSMSDYYSALAKKLFLKKKSYQ